VPIVSEKIIAVVILLFSYWFLQAQADDQEKGVTEPSAASRMVQSNIIGQWVCLINILGLSTSTNLKYLHFRPDGSVEYGQQSGGKLVNKTESYKFIHKGTDKNYPGKNPNILIMKDSNDISGIVFVDVSVDFDSRIPMKYGEVLKFLDIEGNQYLFIKQDKANKIK